MLFADAADRVVETVRSEIQLKRLRSADFISRNVLELNTTKI